MRSSQLYSLEPRKKHSRCDGHDDSKSLDNAARDRYEMQLPGGTAFVDYTVSGKVRTLTHAEVPLALRGAGIAARLTGGVLDLARTQGVKVIPQCPYVVNFMNATRSTSICWRAAEGACLSIPRGSRGILQTGVPSGSSTATARSANSSDRGAVSPGKSIALPLKSSRHRPRRCQLPVWAARYPANH